MQDLILPGMSWCAHHGCPVVALQPVSDVSRQFWISFPPSDAAAMADAASSHESSVPAQTYLLIEQRTAGLDVELSDVHLQSNSLGLLCVSANFVHPTEDTNAFAVTDYWSVVRLADEPVIAAFFVRPIAADMD